MPLRPIRSRFSTRRKRRPDRRDLEFARIRGGQVARGGRAPGMGNYWLPVD